MYLQLFQGMSRGQGFGNLLEERKKRNKTIFFISSAVTPNNEMWRSVCVNNDRLNALHKKCEELFGFNDEGILAFKDPYTVKALTAVRAVPKVYLVDEAEGFVAMGKNLLNG